MGMPYAQMEFFADEAVKCRRMAAAATDAVSRKRWAAFAAEYDRLIIENGGTPPFEEIPFEEVPR